MKILIATFTFPPNKDGISEAAAAAAQAFLARGWEVDIATEPTRLARIRKDWHGAKIYEFRISGSTYFRDPFVGEIKAYQGFLRGGNWDVIFFQSYFWPFYLALDFLDRLPAKKIFVSHGCGAFSWVPSPRFPFGLCRFLSEIFQGLRFLLWCRKFDCLVFYTQRRDWKAFFDVRLATWARHPGIYFIPNGVELLPPSVTSGFFRKKLGISMESSFFLCVANYSQRKDQGFAVRAFRKAGIPGSHLVFIGSEFNESSIAFQQKDAQNATSSLPGKIHWLEKVSRNEILAAISDCDVVVLSANHEGQPFVLLEAMASGRSWIARDAGCISELPGGVVINNVDQMAEFMQRLASDKKTRDRLGKEGLFAARAHFSRKQYAASYCRLIEELKFPSKFSSFS